MAMSEARYPEPPWRMHGRGVFAAVRVPTAELRLPTGMNPVSAMGQSLGLLAFIEYRAPSPLCYRELIFMPAFVRVGDKGKRRSGYYVSTMYVDDEASLEGGRSIWALPKTLARFEVREGSVDVEAGDGTLLSLSFGPRGPRLRAKSRVSTIQSDEGEWVRFRGDFKAEMQLAEVRVNRFESTAPHWDGFDPKRLLPLPGAHFASFESLMQPPRREGKKTR